MTLNKQGYFKFRNKSLSLTVRDDRDSLGEREIKTLQAMMQIPNNDDYFVGKSVLDLGCGDQYIKRALQNRGATYQGIDIDQCNLEIQEFPILSNMQDLVICLALIEHLNDPGHLLAEILRVLKPGGLLWLSTPDIEACGTKFWNDPTHLHPYTRTSIKTLLRMHCFVDVLITPNYRCKPIGFYRDIDFNYFRAHYLLPFEGTSRLPVPEWMKGHCSGLFALATKAEAGSDI